MSDGDPVWLYAVCSRIPEIYCLWLTPTLVNVVTLHSAVRLEHHRAGQNPSWEQGYCVHLGCCHWSGLPEQDVCCSMGDNWALRSPCLSLSSPPMASGISSPLCSPTPLPDPRVSGCKWKFMCWPFKLLFLSPAVYFWQRATLLLFASGCYLCTFCALVL